MCGAAVEQPPGLFRAAGWNVSSFPCWAPCVCFPGHCPWCLGDACHRPFLRGPLCLSRWPFGKDLDRPQWALPGDTSLLLWLTRRSRWPRPHATQQEAARLSGSQRSWVRIRPQSTSPPALLGVFRQVNLPLPWPGHRRVTVRSVPGEGPRVMLVTDASEELLFTSPLWPSAPQSSRSGPPDFPWD